MIIRDNILSDGVLKNGFDWFSGKQVFSIIRAGQSSKKCIPLSHSKNPK